MSEYFELPKKLDPEEIETIEGLRHTYLTFKKRGAEKKFLDNSKNDDFFMEFYKYIIPKEDQQTSKLSKPKLRPLTKKELEDIKYWEDKVKENDKEWKIYKETKKKDGKKVPANKQTAVDNDFRNNDINWRREIQIRKAKPEIELYTKEIKQAYKDGEITKEQMEDMIYGTEKSLSNELELYRRNLAERKEIENRHDAKKEAEVNKMYIDLNNILNQGGKSFTQQKMYDIKPALYKNDYDKAKSLILDIYKEIGMPINEPKKRGRPKKVEDIKLTNKINRRLERYEKNEPLFKEQDIEIMKKHKELMKAGKTLAMDKDIGTIMKGKSDLTKSKSGKYSVNTDLKVKKDLNAKIKKALKQSILTEVDKKFKGSGIRDINLDYSSDDMYGMGYESDSSSDEEDTEEYSKILKHLVGHITDKKEKLDKMDAKQAKEIINRLIKKRGRPKK